MRNFEVGDEVVIVNLPKWLSEYEGGRGKVVRTDRPSLYEYVVQMEDDARIPARGGELLPVKEDEDEETYTSLGEEPSLPEGFEIPGPDAVVIEFRNGERATVKMIGGRLAVLVNAPATIEWRS